MSKQGKGPLIPVLLGLAGVGLIGFGAVESGVFGPRDPDAAPVTAPREGAPAGLGQPSGPNPPGGAPPTGVGGAPGHGTFTHPAPTPTGAADRAALCPDCDVVVVTVCSLRRDHVGAYGVPVGAGLTPALDALAAEGWRFDNAWSASTFTLAGLTAVLTGRFGSSTGVTGWDKGLVGDISTLPEVLGFYGYETAAFTIDAPSGFRPDYGLDKGFQTMNIILPPRDTPDGRHGPGKPGPGGEAVRPALDFLAKRQSDKPLFLMFHSRTAHYPFVLEDDTEEPTGLVHALYETGRQRVAENLPGNAGGTAQTGVVSIQRDEVQELTRSLGPPGLAVWWRTYAAAVTRADIDIAQLIDGLKRAGRWDKTIMLVVADHGESLGDHGELLHGDAYWDSVVHVPLLLRVPGVKPQVSGALVSQVDVLPSLLELVGAVPPVGIDGASVVPLLRGEAEAVRHTTLIEGGVARAQSKTPRGAVIGGDWALLVQDMGCGPDQRTAPRPPGEPFSCLYNLREDPGQTKNQLEAQPAVVADLLGRWASYRASHAHEGSTLQLDPKFVDALQRTGYDFRAQEGGGP